MFKRGPKSSLDKSEQSEGAKQSLVMAALNLFGSKGYEATSTRDIAAAARANIASIAYHFTGKEGLRTACAAFVAGRIGGILGATLPSVAAIAAMSPQQAEEAIAATARSMVRFLVTDPASEPIARFAIREQMMPTPAFEHLYAGLFAPMHERLCSLWAQATGQSANQPETMLRVFSLIGQIMFFRLARHAVFRRMQWKDDEAEMHLNEISSVVEGNIRTLIKEARHHA